jgi:GNAT superfamily N-acetyltransferase
MVPIEIRHARAADVPAIVALLADDELGASREVVADPLPDGYRRAWEAIERSPGSRVVVAEQDGAIVATLQLDVVPSLSRGGMLRAQIEAVRVAGDRRGGGIGRRLIAWAVEEARREGCGLVQLTTDRRRPDALRFYASLGFVDSHHGLKLALA